MLSIRSSRNSEPTDLIVIHVPGLRLLPISEKLLSRDSMANQFGLAADLNLLHTSGPSRITRLSGTAAGSLRRGSVVSLLQTNTHLH